MQIQGHSGDIQMSRMIPYRNDLLGRSSCLRHQNLEGKFRHAGSAEGVEDSCVSVSTW
jgi:hypothetical protein